MSGWCFSGVTGILPGWYFFHDLPDEPREVAVQLIPCFLWYSAEVYIIILFSSKMNLNILGPKRPNHLALISLISRTSFILTILLQNKLQLSPWSKGLSWETLTWCMQLLLQSSDESYGKAQLHELGKQPNHGWSQFSCFLGQRGDWNSSSTYSFVHRSVPMLRAPRSVRYQHPHIPKMLGHGKGLRATVSHCRDFCLGFVCFQLGLGWILLHPNKHWSKAALTSARGDMGN